MKNVWIVLLVVVFAATLLPAQRLLEGINDQGTPIAKTTSDPNYLAFRHVIKQPTVITGCEFLYGATTGTGTVFIFDHDVAGDRPGKLVAQATFPAPPREYTWTGAVFSTPLVISQANTTLWLGWRASVRQKTPAAGRGTTAPTYYWTKSLTAPIPGTALMDRRRACRGISGCTASTGPGGPGPSLPSAPVRGGPPACPGSRDSVGPT